MIVFSKFKLISNRCSSAYTCTLASYRQASHRHHHNNGGEDKSQNKFYNQFYRNSISKGAFLTSLGLLTISVDNKDKNDDKIKTYTLKEVSQHTSLEKGVWTVYKNKVYDITSFVPHHPGGPEIIMSGAGGDIESLWQMYEFHKGPEVQELLSRYYIGDLDERDVVELERLKCQTDNMIESDPYSSDPKRSEILNVLSQKPFNAETPSKVLIGNRLTPNDIFFVRNHLPVPNVDDIQDYKLSICIGTDSAEDDLIQVIEFSYEQLRTLFTPHTVESVVQCSGNRRSDLKKLKEIKGLDWQVGAIGNAKWTGARLVDVLDYIEKQKPEFVQKIKFFKHLQMEGLDCDSSGQTYKASISSDVALDDKREVLLAYEMNGQVLNRDHGFPIRLIVPGVTGARNVKWLSRLTLSHEESSGHWQQNDYKSFSPNVDMFNLDYNKSISIQEMPVQSAICSPENGDIVKLINERKDGKQLSYIPVRGYAYSGGGKMIIRVDISIDNGSSWTTAELEEDVCVNGNNYVNEKYEKRNQSYNWTRWCAKVEIDDKKLSNILKNENKVEILCRAFDSAYNSQPERPETVWNVRGVVNNSWHKIKVAIELCDKTKQVQ